VLSGVALIFADLVRADFWADHTVIGATRPG